MIKRFNRYELKYIVPVSLADGLLADLGPYVCPDPEGGDRGTYQVTSLYFDTADRQFFRSKVEGIKFRRKVRIRRYGVLGSQARVLVAAEIKQRINRTTQKRRVELPLADALKLCAGSLERPWEDPADAAVAGEIEYLSRLLQLSPACTISYVRQAFMGTTYEPGLRVTFDRDLWCRAPEWGLGPDGPRHSFLPADRVVMEVKANDAVPSWMSRLLARHGCALGRFSKYCAGLAHLGARGVVEPVADSSVMEVEDGRAHQRA